MGVRRGFSQFERVALSLYESSLWQRCTSGGICLVVRPSCHLHHVGSSRRGIVMIHTYFSKADMHQIIARGQTPEAVLSQIEIFKRGIPYTTLHRPCTVDDGITVLQQSDIETLGTLYDQAVAADSKNEQDVLQFINNLQRFAFYDDLQAAVQRYGGEIEAYLAHGQYAELLTYLLTSQGLNYANLPKILLKFHRYS